MLSFERRYIFQFFFQMPSMSFFYTATVVDLESLWMSTTERRFLFCEIFHKTLDNKSCSHLALVRIWSSVYAKLFTLSIHISSLKTSEQEYFLSIFRAQRAPRVKEHALSGQPVTHRNFHGLHSLNAKIHLYDIFIISRPLPWTCSSAIIQLFQSLLIHSSNFLH